MWCRPFGGADRFAWWSGGGDDGGIVNGCVCGLRGRRGGAVLDDDVDEFGDPGGELLVVREFSAEQAAVQDGLDVGGGGWGMGRRAGQAIPGGVDHGRGVRSGVVPGRWGDAA